MKTNQTKVTRKQVSQVLSATFPEWRGRRITVEQTDTVTLYNLNWSEGVRNTYRALVSDGTVRGITGAAPWHNMAEGVSVKLTNNVCIVCLTQYQGEEWVTIYVLPQTIIPELRALVAPTSDKFVWGAGSLQIID